MGVANHLLALAGGLGCCGCGRAGSMLCGACRRRLRPARAGPAVPGIDRVLSGCEYDGAARGLVLALKLRSARPAGDPLAALMREEAHRRGLVGSVIAWVPGRRPDIRRRGYDHAEVLARLFARTTGLPPVALLRRVADRPDQTSLTGAQRRSTPGGAFAARPCPDPVILVDDLITTGGTAAACAAELRGGGAPGVELVTACRAR